MVIYISLGLICAILCPIVDYLKCKNVGSAILWFVAGFLFPIISLLLVIVMPARVNAGNTKDTRDAMSTVVAVHSALKQMNYDPNKYVSNEKWDSDIDKKQNEKVSADRACFFKCSSCSRGFQGTRKSLFKRIDCPKCGNVFFAGKVFQEKPA